MVELVKLVCNGDGDVKYVVKLECGGGGEVSVWWRCPAGNTGRHNSDFGI